jgi:hypothetical protein
MSFRLASALRAGLIGTSLLTAGLALADAAPYPDAGNKSPDMATTMAKPDMSVPTTPSDSGCSMAGHGTKAGSLLVFGGALAALSFSARKRRS